MVQLVGVITMATDYLTSTWQRIDGGGSARRRVIFQHDLKAPKCRRIMPLRRFLIDR